MTIKRVGINNIGIIGLGEMGGGAAVGGWSPLKPTSDGGLLPHTWYYAGQAAIYQDAAMTIPATADGDVVGGMPNQGSDVYSVTQAVTANKPTLRLNVQGGKPVLRFDGGDWLQGAFAGAVAIAQPFTLFAVAQLNIAAVDIGTITLLDSDDVVNRLLHRQYVQVGPDVWGIHFGVDLNGGVSDSDWNIWTTLANGVSSQFWLNGLSEASGNAGVHTPDGITIAANRQGTNWWVGDIAEILIYSANLSNADKNQLGRYLGTKYNIGYTNI